jgi:hypothetical protein
VNTAATITTETALFEAYQDWHRLAELEGEAIEARDWTLVKDCQRRLSELQPRIIRLTNFTREEWKRAGADLAEKEKNLRQIVSGLIELELQNSTLLTAAKEGIRVKVDQLDLVRQNLKRVQRSYSPMRPAVFSSFS